MTRPASADASRRTFLTASAVAVASASAAALQAAGPARPGGSDVLKVGLIGCGGRGTGAAAQALKADRHVKLTAVADVFRDKWQATLGELRGDAEIAAKIDVKPQNCFDGLNAYQQLLATDVDVVLLTTPPGFRPLHLAAAVAANKHIFCEKPMAVDAPGVRSVLESAREAKRKNRALVAGFCYRYERVKQETMARVHDGQIGDVIALHTNYNTGALWHKARQPGWSDTEWHLRNWPYFTYLSGDHIVEQHCHSLDKMAWAMKNQYPVRAVGLGGRQSRTAPEFGHIFDHHAVVFEYANGVKLFSYCRQQVGTTGDVSDHVMGTLGTCDVMRHRITGKRPWTGRRRPNDNMYQNEHNDLFASIRAGTPINDGEWMAHSTLMAIMGRMATYTGKAITWDMAMKSKEVLMPANLDLKGRQAMPPVARPGFTPFV